MTACETFERLLKTVLIPDFCSDESRRMAPSGFVESSNRVAEVDAADFLRGWETGLPVHQGRGQYLVGHGRVKEQFFSSGSKSVTPRTFTLWMEPVITVAAIARLHLDHGWPISLLAAQSDDWAYDIVGRTMQDGAVRVAGEVKKSRREVDKLIDELIEFGSDLTLPNPLPEKYKNSLKKLISLRKIRAPILWVVGPDCYQKVFLVRYEGDIVSFVPAPLSALAFLP